MGYPGTASALTAGIASSFTIQAVDTWGNLLTTSNDVFQFASVPYFTQDTVTRPTYSFHPPAATTASQLNVNDAAYDDLSLTVAASVAPLGSGRYAVSYQATRSGWYFIRGRLTQAGGLYGVYSESTLLVEGGGSAVAQPAAQRVDVVIDFDWGTASPLHDWSPGMYLVVLCCVAVCDDDWIQNDNYGITRTTPLTFVQLKMPPPFRPSVSGPISSESCGRDS